MPARAQFTALPIALLTILTFCPVLSAQSQDVDDVDNALEFRLFEEVETATSQQEERVRRQRESDGNRASQPEFTLVGTSRIGSRYSAILKHRGGDSVYIRNLNPDGSNRIPGHRNHTIVDVAAGRLSVRFPDSDPCLTFEDQGVSCNEAVNIAILILANGEPLQPPASESDNERSDIAAGDEEAGRENTGREDTPTNPFAVLRAAAENGATTPSATPENNRFTPRRIAPEDVPQGMRVVSTPFGDRLVEQ